MALLDFRGFEHIEASTGANPSLWINYSQSATAGFVKVAGELQGSQLQANSGTRVLWYDDAVNHATLIVGARIKTGLSLGGIVTDWVIFYDTASIQCGVSINAASKLIFWRGSNATVLGTGTTTLVTDTYYYLEIKVTFHNSTGAFEVKIGTVSECSGSGVDTCNTANNQATGVKFSLSVASGGMVGTDDMYILDALGSAPHNNYLGIVLVETLLPTTNNSVQFTPLSSTNASNVDDTGYDGDTTYNSSSTSGHVDTFNHGSLVSTPSTIFGVAIRGYARKDDVAVRNFRTKLISGGTTSSGASMLVDTTYKMCTDYYTADPDTAVAWITAGVNATKIGYEHV